MKEKLSPITVSKIEGRWQPVILPSYCIQRDEDHNQDMTGYGTLAGAKAAAREMNERRKERTPCDACFGLGWWFFSVDEANETTTVVQRCDACEKFDSDETASAAACPILERILRDHVRRAMQVGDLPMQHVPQWAMVPRHKDGKE